MKNVTNIYVGVDVAKTKLDVHLHPLNLSFTVENSKRGVNKLIKILNNYTVARAACEASGGQEYLLKTIFDEANLPMWIVDPNRIIALKRARGIKAKNDTIDAKAIAIFAATQEAPKIIVQSEQQIILKTLIKRRNDLVDMACE